jgi:hypothetical protein
MSNGTDAWNTNSNAVHQSIADWGAVADGNISLTCAGDSLYLGAVGTSTSLLMDASNTASIFCGQAQFILASNDDLCGVQLAAGLEGTIQMSAGPPEEGSLAELAPETITIQLGVPDVGALIKMTPESITLSVGPPGEGSSITLTPESITIKVAEVTMTMSPEGIVEDVAEVTREMTAEGHNLTAAETEFNVGVEGEAKEGPVKLEEVEGGSVENETLGMEGTDAMKNEAAAIMITE